MFYLEKIWKNKFRNVMIVLILLFPLLENIAYLQMFSESIYRPVDCFFLTCHSVGYAHLLQSIFLWLLPLYLLIIFSNAIWNEEKTGYSNLIKSRVGNRSYIKSNMFISFLGAFVLVMLSMLLNMLMVHILFNGGKASPCDTELITDVFLNWQSHYPLLANLLFSVVLSVVAGIISMVSSLCAIAFKNVKLIYGLILACWFALLLKKNSVVLLFQPQSEYGLKVLVPIFFEIIFIFGMIGVVAYIKEIKIES